MKGVSVIKKLSNVLAGHSLQQFINHSQSHIWLMYFVYDTPNTDKKILCIIRPGNSFIQRVV